MTMFSIKLAMNSLDITQEKPIPGPDSTKSDAKPSLGYSESHIALDLISRCFRHLLTH